MDTEKRDLAIYEGMLDGKSMSELGRKYGLSRERVRQIYSNITDSNTLDSEVVKYWVYLARLAKNIGIDLNFIRLKAKCAYRTAQAILAIDKRYVGTNHLYHRELSNTARERVAKVILEEAIRKIDKTADILDKILTYK